MDTPTPDSGKDKVDTGTIALVTFAIIVSQAVASEMTGQPSWLRVIVAGIVGGAAAWVYTWTRRLIRRKKD